MAIFPPVDGYTITMYNSGNKGEERQCINVQQKQVW